MAPSSLAHPGAVDIDLAAECEKLGQLARAPDLVEGPQELRQPGCALRAGDRLDGLARDGIPRVLAYLDQVIVGALLGEHAYLFDAGKILDPGPSVNGGLYGALRHGADRPALHEGLAHPSERDARVQPLAQHVDRVVLHVHFLHEAALPDERPYRRFDADLREETR